MVCATFRSAPEPAWDLFSPFHYRRLAGSILVNPQLESQERTVRLLASNAGFR
jgi:hypothetical protein